MISIIAMTTLCADVFDASGEIMPGGEALNFAAVASEYAHVDVGLIGAVGDDIYGQQILASIRGKRIRTDGIHIVAGGRTATNRIYLTQDGDRYFKPDSWDGGVYASFRLSEEDKSRILGADVVFINYSSPNFQEVLTLRKTGKFRLAADFDMVRDFVALQPFVHDIDFFFISGEEALLPHFRKWSEEYDSIFNITLAAQGSVSYQTGQEFRVQAVPVAEVIDTTGCGDSYHAAFLCSYLRDMDIPAAMAEGSAAASETLRHIGGFVPSP